MMKLDFYTYINYKHITVAFTAAVMLILNLSCSGEQTHNAPAVSAKDSLPFLQSTGIATLISDSGVIRYKILCEEWNIYNTTRPPKWTFVKGILLEKFGATYHTDWFIQADTAYCYDQRLWELRGRVVVRNHEGTLFRTELLFWNMDSHEIYSKAFMRITTPERELQGHNFKFNEQMTQYRIYDSQGALPMNEGEAPSDSTMREGPARPK